MMFVCANTRLPRGGGSPDPAINRVVAEFQNMDPGKISVGTVVLTARPLCTERRRVFFFVSCEEGISGEQLAQDAALLHAKVAAKLPHHDLESFLFQEDGADASPVPSSAVNQAEDLVKYTTAYSKGLQKAMKGKKLKDPETMPGSQRPSVRDAALAILTPWRRAQADICKQMLLQKNGGEDRFLIGRR